MPTDHNIIPLDNNTDLLLLDDEDDFRNVATIEQEHKFLNFSRKIAESASMKRPVDIQLGIACGKDLIFSRHLFDKKKAPPFQFTTPTTTLPTPQENEQINNKKEGKMMMKNQNNNGNLLPPLPPIMQQQDEMKKEIAVNNNKKTLSSSTSDKSGKGFKEMHMNHSKRKSGLLDRLVADVLKHIESCPGQSAYSIDLDRLKPKLEAYKINANKSTMI